jgi:hypothetical protein
MASVAAPLSRMLTSSVVRLIAYFDHSAGWSLTVPAIITAASLGSYSGHSQDEPMIHDLETAGDGLIWFVTVELPRLISGTRT